MPSKRVAILQSSYIPWKGYFDIINSVDEFILYDDTQFTKRDWRTRNKIKTKDGSQWLTIPVQTKGKYTQNICETEIAEPTWAKDHWRTIYHAYNKAPFFREYANIFENIYEKCTHLRFLSEINELFIRSICDLLSIKSNITQSSNYGFSNLHKTDRLVAICQSAEANVYLSGPAAKTYIDNSAFQLANIELEYMNYDNYSEYQQCFSPFEHAVSIIDLLFNTGSQAIKYLKSTRK